MSAYSNIYHVGHNVFTILLEVVFFWQRRLQAWWTRKKPRDAVFETLTDARIFEEWEAAAFQLDELLGNDLWRQNPTSKYYDYRLIYERLQAIIEAREEDDILTLVNLLRSGLVRNLGNITTPRLFNRAYAGTKLLIEDYITQVALAIEHVTAYPTSPLYDSGLSSQAKLDLLHDTRQAFGRTALVLQGGAIFGLCHIGVVKALHLRGLLPRIIAGSATGALIAALVGVHTEDELLDFLTGQRIDLTAFATTGDKKSPDDKPSSAGWFATLVRRVKRFVREGYFLDVRVLEDCVRANVGDMTFEEAYTKTKRVLNITVATSTSAGVPSLLNYLTAPNVLIWSAAVASNTANTPLYSPVTLLSKDTNGNIHPWTSTPTHTSAPPSPTIPRRPSTTSTPSFPPPPPSTYQAPTHDTPLARIASLFNVNHFLISQARPYIAPFLQSTAPTSPRLPGRRRTTTTTTLFAPLLRVVALELQHRLRQLDALSLLPPSTRRFLVDEAIPASSSASPSSSAATSASAASLTLAPRLDLSDFWGLLRRPTPDVVDSWILRGERCVWPAVSALKIRCAVEVELDRGYQVVRRRKPMDAVGGAGGVVVVGSGGVAAGALAAGAATGSGAEQLKGTGRARASSLSAAGAGTGGGGDG